MYPQMVPLTMRTSGSLLPLQEAELLLAMEMQTLAFMISLANLVRQRLSGTERFSDVEINQVVSAVREALLNAHFHGNLEANRHPLELS